MLSFFNQLYLQKEQEPVIIYDDAEYEEIKKNYQNVFSDSFIKT